MCPSGDVRGTSSYPALVVGFPTAMANQFKIETSLEWQEERALSTFTVLRIELGGLYGELGQSRIEPGSIYRPLIHQPAVVIWPHEQYYEDEQNS
jgi:hypothetical protein